CFSSLRFSLPPRRRQCGGRWCEAPEGAPGADIQPPPCNAICATSDKVCGAVAGGRPTPPRALKARTELGSPLVVPSNPNSRLGRKKRSPIVQGGVKMETTIVG